MDRRSWLKTVGAGITAGLAGCMGQFGAPGSPNELSELHIIQNEGSLTHVTYQYAMENGVFEEHGIDLTFEVAGFGKYSRAVVDGLTPIGGNSTIPSITLMNEGEDIVFIGRELHMMNRIFARADDDSIGSVTDLAGKSLGVPFMTSSTTLTLESIIKELFDFDIKNDPANTNGAAPPVIWSLLIDGELDAGAMFNSQTIEGMANPDMVKTVFNPYQIWVDETGVPPAATHFVARRSWLDDNAAIAVDFLDAAEAMMSLFEENVADALQRFGRYSGLDTEEEIKTVQDNWGQSLNPNPKLTDDNPTTSPESVYRLLELVRDNTSQFESIPPLDDIFVTWSELQSMA